MARGSVEGMTGAGMGAEHVLSEVTRLLARRPPAAGPTRVVAVDGPSGAGKTTFAAALADPVGAPVVHMDDLYPGWDGLEDGVPRLLEWVLEPLAARRPAAYRRYDWGTGDYAEWHPVPAGDLLVVEGAGSAARACAPYLSVLVWVQAPAATRLARGRARDGAALETHWHRWARHERRHFAAEGTEQRADVVLDTGGPTTPTADGGGGPRPAPLSRPAPGRQARPG